MLGLHGAVIRLFLKAIGMMMQGFKHLFITYWKFDRKVKVVIVVAMFSETRETRTKIDVCNKGLRE